jgi:hypothetical protein
VNALGRGRWNDHSQINRSGWNLPRLEIAPDAERISHRVETQGAGKIISTACRDDQHWKLQTDQRGQVPVNGAVSTKNQNGVGIVG